MLTRKTIKGRVTITIVVILAISILAITSLNIGFLGGRLRQSKEEQLLAQAERYAEAVNTQFMREIGMVEGVACAIAATDDLNPRRVKDTVDEFYGQYPELLNVYMGSRFGMFYQANQAEMPKDYDPTKRPWYISAVENKGIAVVNPYVDQTFGDICATVSIPIYINGAIEGVAAIDISVDTIVNLVNKINYTRGSYGFLVDSDGNYVVHPNKDYMPNTEGATAVSDVMPALVELVKSADGSIVKAVDYDGSECYFACSKILGCGWTLGISIPESTVMADVNRAIVMTIILAAAILIFQMLIVSRRTYIELAPVEKMIPAVEQLAKGDLSTNLDFGCRNDELGELQNSLSQLVAIFTDVINEENRMLVEISGGDLSGRDMDSLPGDFNEIADSVNSIKATLNALIKEIQFAAINLQSTAMGFTGAANPEDMLAIFNELSVEANDLMEKANMFKTDLN